MKRIGTALGSRYAANSSGTPRPRSSPIAVPGLAPSSRGRGRPPRARRRRASGRRSRARPRGRPGSAGREAGRHAVALVLAVGRVRELLAERVGRVEERARQLAVRRQRQRLAEGAVLRRVEDEADRVVVGERGARRAEHLAHRRGEDLLVVRLPVHEPRHAARRARGRTPRGTCVARRAHARQRLEGRVLRRLLERQRILEDRRVERVVAQDLGDHLPDDLALLGRRVERLAEPPVAEERDARDRVVQVREGRDGQHVARDLLRALLDGAREARPAVAPRPAREDAEVALGRERRQQLRQPGVGRLLARAPSSRRARAPPGPAAGRRNCRGLTST